MTSEMQLFTAGFGIDGARAGWVVASLDQGTPRLQLVEDLETLADAIDRHGAVVDIPVGLPGGPHEVRRCDRLARRLLGPRRSSVFPAPSRAALDAGEWAEANRINREATGRGLPRQSWGLVPKIRHVDRILRGRPDLRTRLREGHPELAFSWLNGGIPMPRPKREAEGLAERWRLLERVWSGVEMRATEWARGSAGVGADDVADALALLALGVVGATPMPASPPIDEVGLRMEILVHPSLRPTRSRRSGGPASE